ncbi:1-phosphofructokinase [Vibrio metschnikovii]|uniref:1-phosphofructokinase n=1 Tax=Vibrio metschnikovii TaxID=28172 RepID=UPI0001B95355|nr:1-phosphofructokinase [Vibrio metschnikovii]EEX35968.1 1-phosphofructokinase [Vibrio metschnikovii CIP 69.14]MBC3616270.1 1-phosphofructokinase [Vibrio metschnikovii]MBC5812282.1 1-phosphofructokinase [Vibrio metschnikovii]SUP49499.1 1-phosphofructokinase [Vibrio metschnikovii]SUQ10060.1 1-phosphofructokinase [Vibrio metschnikovii]
MSMKVVTITLNPALDLTGSMEKLRLGSVSLVQQGSLHAAGKGVNVAKVLSDLGAQVTVTGFLGQDNQEMFCQLFAEIGANDQFIRLPGATRINVKLVEQSGQVSDINFPGIHVNEQDIQRFEQRLFQLADDHEYFIIAGSLPSGLSPQRCARWIEQLGLLGKKVLFDSSREALIAGVDAKPWLIKPNEEELAQFVGHPLHSPEECQAAAQQLADKGIANIVVSMGAQGTMWLNQGQWLHAKPPKMPVVSTVGAGDTLVAGLCWGHMQNMDKSSLITFATALSALAVTQVGVGVPDINKVTALQNDIQL